MNAKTLTTPEALQYIADHTGRDSPPHKQQLNRWQQYGWIRPIAKGGVDGKPNIYSVVSLDELCRKINEGHRMERKVKKLKIP